MEGTLLKDEGDAHVVGEVPFGLVVTLDQEVGADIAAHRCLPRGSEGGLFGSSSTMFSGMSPKRSRIQPFLSAVGLSRSTQMGPFGQLFSRLDSGWNRPPLQAAVVQQIRSTCIVSGSALGRGRAGRTAAPSGVAGCVREPVSLPARPVKGAGPGRSPRVGTSRISVL